MGLAAHNYESTNGYLPPNHGTVVANGLTYSNDASTQALILPYVEQASKYNQFNFNYKTWNDTVPVDPNTNKPLQGIPANPGVNLAARIQDIPFYICPSDPSDTRRGANQNNTSDLTYPEGRLNYLGCLGTTGRGFLPDPMHPQETLAPPQTAGIFALIAIPAGDPILQGLP